MEQRKVSLPLERFSDWHKINEKVLKDIKYGNIHKELKNGASSSGKHSSMMQKAEDLKQRFDKPNTTILYNFRSTWQETVARNLEILKWIITMGN